MSAGGSRFPAIPSARALRLRAVGANDETDARWSWTSTVYPGDTPCCYGSETALTKDRQQDRHR